MPELLIVNDLHPDELPGAASIALDLANTASKQMSTSFLYTSNKSGTSKVGALNCISVRREKKMKIDGYLGQVYNFISDCFGFKQAIRFRRIIRSTNADIIWFHQIGNYIPRLTVFLLGKKSRTLMTLHDFNLIVPRKLYPIDLTSNLLKMLSIDYKQGKTLYLRRLSKSLPLCFYFIRRRLLRSYLKKCRLIGISKLQADIYLSFGFPIYAIVPNGIEQCKCKTRSSARNKGSVFFVGRIIGKGFDRLIKSASLENMKVYLAGDHDLLESAKKFGSDLKFEYLGKLSRAEVFENLHRMEFTFVASDCFDVYPTIGLEAIRHGSVPITSETTGIRDLVRSIHPSLVLKSNEHKVPFSEIRANEKSIQPKLNLIEKEIPTTKEVLDAVIDSTGIS